LSPGVNFSPIAADRCVSELKTRRTTMSRKVILSIATAATIAAASLGSTPADARGFGGGGGFGGGHFAGGGGFGGRGNFGGGRASFATLRGPGHSGLPLHPIFPPGHPGHPGWWGHHHFGHWIFRGGRWVIIDEVVDEPGVVLPAPVLAPGPCTCLTKTYTPDGLVVFADVCTNEAASARVDGGPAADATPVPTPPNAPAPPVDGKTSDATQAPTSPNYAGRTYQDFLAANPQAAQAPQKN
jgi:hypothetical protein